MRSQFEMEAGWIYEEMFCYVEGGLL